jgi:eukaryotic-like serine/threonine-protein kinase
MDFAEAHCNLGLLLQEKGEFTEALAALSRGHALGSRDPRWPYPSAQWLRRCDRWIQLDAEVPAILCGEAPPASDAARLEFARLCSMKRLYRSAARFFEEAFKGSPQLAQDLKSGDRYAAAVSAARAGCGQGEEAAKFDEPERARWRKQALSWLRADLALLAGRLKDGTPQDRKLVTATLRRWQQDSGLAGLREAAAVALLPPVEQEACTRFWTEVEALLRKVQAKTR